jgi:aspartate kinase
MPRECGAALVKDEARIAIIGVPDQPGVSHRIFAAVADKNVVVDMIAQNVASDRRASIGFTVPAGELVKTLEILSPLARELGATVEKESQVSKVSIVGTGMRTHTGVAERMFAALATCGVNMKMITTADIKISVLVDRADGMRALQAVHQAFGLDRARPGAGLPAGAGLSAVLPRPGATPAPRRDLATLTQRLSSMEDIVVSDVFLSTDQGRITIYSLPDRPGVCSRIFQVVAAGGIVVDMIVQNLTEGKNELSFSVPQGDLAGAARLTEEVVGSIESMAWVTAEPNIATLHVLGVGMRTHTGVARRMFGALAEKGINISLINTSEVRVSVVVDRSHGEDALACLKQAFGVE